jgi:alpha-L-rhamnosidase
MSMAIANASLAKLIRIINQISHYRVEREFSLASHTHEFQITYSSQWTEWLMHVVLMAWEDFMETGDTSSMAHYYEDLKAKTLMALARRRWFN